MKKLIMLLAILLFCGSLVYGQAVGRQYEMSQHTAQTVTLDSTDLEYLDFLWQDSRGHYAFSAGNMTLWAYVTSTGTEIDSTRVWYKPLDMSSNPPDNDSTFVKSDYVDASFTDGARYMWRVYPDPSTGIRVWFEQTANDSTSDDNTTISVYLIEQ